MLFVRLYTNAKPQDWYGAVLLGDACKVDPSLGRHVRTLELCNKVERGLYVPLNAVINNMPNLSQIKSQEWRRDAPRRFAAPPTLFIEWGEFAGLAESAEGLEVAGGVQVRKRFVGKNVAKVQPSATKGVATRSRGEAPTPAASSDAARQKEPPDEARHGELKQLKQKRELLNREILEARQKLTAQLIDELKTTTGTAIDSECLHILLPGRVLIGHRSPHRPHGRLRRRCCHWR